jgi:hypothetical protein
MIAAAWAVVLISSAALTAPMPPQRPSRPQVTAEAATIPLPNPAEMVCRDPRLWGDPKPDIIDVGGLACGIDDPVRIISISGIRLSPPALLGCRTARRLADWLTGVVKVEALEHLQSNIAEVQVMGSYACRSRNNIASGRLSEHARGRAIDIGGFTLTDGRQVIVARDWGKTPPGDFLRRIWRKGCGPFATVLGPGADRHHRDHLHLDTSLRGGEPYCR